MAEQIILIGGGGHCESCIDVIERQKKYQIAGIVDIKENIGKKVLGYDIIAHDDQIPELIDQYHNFFITLGQIKTAEKRKKLYERLKKYKVHLPILISPYAYVSDHCIIGPGTIIHHHALLNSGVSIGCNCIVNSKALLEHGVNVGSHCHISTGAIINGNVTIENDCFIGSGAVIKQDLIIGKQSMIKLGSKLTKSLE